MPFYKVTKTVEYTESVYVEADNEQEASELSGTMEGERHYDDCWINSTSEEVTQDEFNDNQ